VKEVGKLNYLCFSIMYDSIGEALLSEDLLEVGKALKEEEYT
jgi:hypothetical protein